MPAAGKHLKRLVGVMPTVPLAGVDPDAWFESGTVATVTAGAASDGNALATVTWRDDVFPMPYLSSYTPVVGHTVLLAYQHPQVVILGRIIGTP